MEVTVQWELPTVTFSKTTHFLNVSSVTSSSSFVKSSSSLNIRREWLATPSNRRCNNMQIYATKQVIESGLEKEILRSEGVCCVENCSNFRKVKTNVEVIMWEDICKILLVACCRMYYADCWSTWLNTPASGGRRYGALRSRLTLLYTDWLIQVCGLSLT